METLQHLIELLDEDSGDIEEPICRTTTLANKLKKMQTIRGNSCLASFLDLVQKDISMVNWKKLINDNLSKTEREALHEGEEYYN